jgi:hypothetical protein
MLKRYKIALVVTSVLAITAVMFMYSKNYISFESGIHITFPEEPDEKYVEREFQPANVEDDIKTNVPVSEVRYIPPSNEDTKVDEGRFFDDMMKFIETVMPMAVVLIPIYLNKRNRNKIRTADA